MSAQQDQFVIIGRVGTAHGVRGLSKIYSFTDPLDNLLTYNPLYLRQKNDWQQVKISDHRLQGNQIVARLNDCEDRDSALALTHAEIGIKREQLEELADNEFYWAELEGLDVFNHEGLCLGKVDYLFATGSNDVLVVKGDKTRMIPYILGDVIKKVDIEKKRIDVEWDAEF